MARKQQKAPTLVPGHILEHLQNQPGSGLTVAQYSSKHDFSTWSFYQWRKRYQSCIGQTEPPATRQQYFAEVGRLTASETDAAGICDIHLGNGVSITVRRGATREELAMVLSHFKQEAPC